MDYDPNVARAVRQEQGLRELKDMALGRERERALGELKKELERSLMAAAGLKAAEGVPSYEAFERSLRVTKSLAGAASDLVPPAPKLSTEAAALSRLTPEELMRLQRISKRAMEEAISDMATGRAEVSPGMLDYMRAQEANALLIAELRMDALAKARGLVGTQPPPGPDWSQLPAEANPAPAKSAAPAVFLPVKRRIKLEE